MEGELSAHLTSGAVIVYLIQHLKGARWCPWLTPDSTTLAALVSAVSAAAVAFGINWTFQPASPGDTAGVLTIQIPTFAALLRGVWGWLVQFTSQQLIYDGVIQRAGKP